MGELPRSKFATQTDGKIRNKLLIISGPTATGKTALAVEVAREFGGELISADSRQVYLGLDIGVGKDHPQGTPIHLIDLITPDQVFSVAEFRRQAQVKISEIHSRGHLPIVVGCTGLYISSLLRPYHTLNRPPLPWLRFLLDHLPVFLLQKSYQLLDPRKYQLLNHSDVNNPRRLIRKIEIAISLFRHKKNDSPPLSKGGLRGGFDLLHLSLTAPNSFLFPRIDGRVEERLTAGHLQELENLLKKYRWSDPGLKVSAYASFKPFSGNHQTLVECIQKWKYREHRDARRQKTWFKVQSPATFVDVSRPDYTHKALSFVNKWYNQL